MAVRLVAINILDKKWLKILSNNNCICYLAYLLTNVMDKHAALRAVAPPLFYETKLKFLLHVFSFCLAAEFSRQLANWQAVTTLSL